MTLPLYLMVVAFELVSEGTIITWPVDGTLLRWGWDDDFLHFLLDTSSDSGALRGLTRGIWHMACYASRTALRGIIRSIAKDP